MRIPFLQKKPVIPRSADGTFAVKNSAPAATTPANAPVKQLETDMKIFEIASKFQEGLDKMVTARQNALESMIPGEPAGENSTLEIVLSALETFAPVITPYVPAIMERLGLSAASIPNSPAPPVSSSPPAAQAEDNSVINLISMAADTPPTLIKPFIPKLNSELEKRGLDKEKFKRAVQNISKAYD